MGKLGKIIAIFCALTLTVSLLTSCNSKNSDNNSSNSSAPVTLSLIEPDLGRVLKPDTENSALMQLEKNTNTKLEITLVPGSNFNDKYTVLASSNELPDISRLSNFDYQKYAAQGLFMDIGSLVDKYGPNLKDNIPQDAWDVVKLDGKLICIPYLNSAGKNVTVFRQDWLDNVGLSMPKTLDDYKKVLEAFTFKDPDKNGKNDTYGMGAYGGITETSMGSDFQAVFGAYGIATGMSYLKDNKIYNSMITDQYRKAIEFIKGLWDEKVIDPELFTIQRDQANQKFVQSKVGSVTGWWSQIPQNIMVKLKMNEVNPNAKWTPVTTAITGPDGQSGYPSSGNINATLCISAKSKNAEAAIKFLDYLATKDGYLLASKGIQGEHWTTFGAPLTDVGRKAYDDKWLDPLSQFVARLDVTQQWNDTTTDPIQQTNNIYINAAANLKLISNILYGVPITEVQSTYGTDLIKYEVMSFIGFVTGSTPLNDSTWNNYVNTWKNAKQGQKIFQSQIDSYNKLKGTNYTAGN